MGHNIKNHEANIPGGFFSSQYRYWTDTVNDNCDDAIAKTVKNQKRLPIDMDSTVLGLSGLRNPYHGIYGVCPESPEYIGASGMEPCIGVCIYSESAGMRAAFHFAQTDNAYYTLGRYNRPADCRAILAGAHSSNFTTQDRLSDILSFMWWNNIKIDGFRSSKDVDGIYVDRKGNWVVVPSKKYQETFIGPVLIRPQFQK
jgi:hypothetical protein